MVSTCGPVTEPYFPTYNHKITTYIIQLLGVSIFASRVPFNRYVDILRHDDQCVHTEETGCQIVVVRVL